MLQLMPVVSVLVMNDPYSQSLVGRVAAGAHSAHSLGFVLRSEGGSVIVSGLQGRFCSWSDSFC